MNRNIPARSETGVAAGIILLPALAEFVMLPKFGTSTFFLLTLMAMVDFLGGIALHARRGSVTSRRSHTPVETPEGEHRIEPVPAAPAPAPTATPAAESVSDNSRPKLSVDRPSVDRPSVDKPSVDKPSMDKPVVDKPVVDKPAGEPSPTIPSPDLQPGTGSSSSPGASH